MSKFDCAYVNNAFAHFSMMSRTTFSSKEDKFSPFMFFSLDFNKFSQFCLVPNELIKNAKNNKLEFEVFSIQFFHFISGL